MGFIKTLKFQVSSALFTMVLLFVGSMAFTFFGMQEQRSNNAVLYLAGKLQATAHHLASQAMHYKQNAPRDYPTYYRDIKLYYQDLMHDMTVFNQIANAFMQDDFEPALTGLADAVFHRLSDETRAAVNEVERLWGQYHKELMDALGSDPEKPRLEYAAEHIIANETLLDQATNNLYNTLRDQVDLSLDRINRIHQLALVLILAIAVGIVYWFYLKVLRPLDSTVKGFRRVAQGDFGHQITASTNNELRWLSEGFNLLSRRLNALFQLIDRLQGGSNLDQTLQFVSEEFSSLLPLDWVGILFVTGNGTSIKLDRSYSEGKVEVAVQTLFALPGTFLEKALLEGKPTHVPDIPVTAHRHPKFRLLQLLAQRDLRDAIFLPVTSQSPVPGVLVFATRQYAAYTPDHLELLSNLAHLVSHSFGRTVRLAEHARLAAIGEFASGIAHEIRTPLTTINLALDYFQRMELPEAARKRAGLAAREAERMARLIDDMLLYAKPIQLDMQPLNLADEVSRLLNTDLDTGKGQSQRFELEAREEKLGILADRDRLTQIFLNLARNASEAAPEGGVISWRLSVNSRAEMVALEIRNGGDPIPPEILPELTAPFFTTKTSGTGLGLSIVKRLVEAHGGELQIASDAHEGTRVRITLPHVPS